MTWLPNRPMEEYEQRAIDWLHTPVADAIDTFCPALAADIEKAHRILAERGLPPSNIGGLLGVLVFYPNWSETVTAAWTVIAQRFWEEVQAESIDEVELPTRKQIEREGGETRDE